MSVSELEKPRNIPVASKNLKLHNRIKEEAHKKGQSVTKFCERTLMEKVGIKVQPLF